MPVTSAPYLKYLQDQPLGIWGLEARTEWLRLERENAAAIKRLYLTTAGALARKVEKLPANDLTGKAYKSIETDLIAESAKLGMGLEDRLKVDTAKAVATGTKGTQKALAGLIDKAGIGLSPAVMQKAFVSVNQWATMAQWARTANGLTLSDRIWSTAGTFRQDLKTLIDMAVESGLGAKDTAVLIDKLASEGGYQLKRTVLENYPKAVERFGKFYDGQTNWEALRLARTELAYAANEGVVIAGRLTPGYLGARWILSDAHPETDICDDYASADDYGLGPGGYSKGNEVLFAHPNCLCHIESIFEDREEIVRKLQDWKKDPAAWPDMEDWHQKVYQGIVNNGVVDVPAAMKSSAK